MISRERDDVSIYSIVGLLKASAFLVAFSVLSSGAQASQDWGFGGYGIGFADNYDEMPTVQNLIDEGAATSFSRNYGAGLATGRASLTAEANVEVHDSDDSIIPVGRADASVLGLAQITLLGHTAEAARLEMNGLVESHDFELNANGTDMLSIEETARYDASVTARIAGVTLLSNDWGDSVDYNPATAISDQLGLAGSIPLASTGPLQRSLFSFSYNFAIGPVPVSVGASAGAGVEMGSDLHFDALEMEVGIDGNANAYANGELTAGIDALVLAVGLAADADFANTGAAVSLDADSNGLHGGFTASMTPIALRLYGYARVGYGWFSYTYWKTIFYWTSGTHTYQRDL